MSTLQNGTLITFYEHYKINLEAVLVEKKDKILGFDLVCLFQLFLKVSIFSEKTEDPELVKLKSREFQSLRPWKMKLFDIRSTNMRSKAILFC